ncbi:MAG: type III-B CRISPR module RAMP protein Cmr6 [Limisphaerales bacterium]
MIFAAPDTLSVWKALCQQRQHARTLAADRFVDFPDNAADKEHRRRSCQQIRDGKALTQKLPGWRSFCRALPDGDAGLVFARLKARLIVNAAGGVMENGGLCLDRTSGVPFIPGSAVKGCARKLAISTLKDATEAEKATVLEQVAWLFGWGDTDWKDGRKRAKNGKPGELHSDFEFACGESEPWKTNRERVTTRLLTRLGVDRRMHPDEPWLVLPSFAGAIQFLPAFPWQADPGIDLDIVTPHHTAYYEGQLTEATDTEEPTPSVFPVVSEAKEPLFVFTLARSPRASAEDLSQAREWLREGLTLLGIGGRTSAGYGCFESSQELDQATIDEARGEERKKEEEAVRCRAEAERRQREDQERLKREEARRLTASMTPEQMADFEIKDWDDNRLKNHLDLFAKLTPEQQGAVYRLLRGAKTALWREIRKLALEGKAKERSRWSPFTSAMFVMAKQRREKMP